MSETVLTLTNVTKKYGERHAVDNVSLSVNSGEVFGFIGPNGAGKTTTIRLIVGLASITSGEIRVCGHSVKNDFENAIRNVGGIIENPELYGFLTGRQNLELFAGLYKEVGKERVDEVIKLVGLENRINDRMKKYSLGMRQRVGIAQSLLHSPKILILDEPTNGLDPAGIHEMRDLLKKLAHEHGVAVFISSHILSEMQLMCDRAAIIDHGKLVQVLTLEELNQTNTSTHSIKTDNGEKAFAILSNHFEGAEISAQGNMVSITIREENMPQAIKLLVEGGVGVYGAKTVTVDLESKFLDITKNSRIK